MNSRSDPIRGYKFLVTCSEADWIDPGYCKITNISESINFNNGIPSIDVSDVIMERGLATEESRASIWFNKTKDYVSKNKDIDILRRDINIEVFDRSMEHGVMKIILKNSYPSSVLKSNLDKTNSEVLIEQVSFCVDKIEIQRFNSETQNYEKV